MSSWWTTVGSILWTLIFFPILYLLEHLLALLLLILSPVLHILQYALHLLFLPLRFLAKFETLYIYFGTATVLGLFTGLVLYATFYLIGPLFGTQREVDRDPPRTAASYRAERAERKAQVGRERTALGMMSSGSSGGVMKVEDGQMAPTAMMGTMILEEGSSSE